MVGGNDGTISNTTSGTSGQTKLTSMTAPLLPPTAPDSFKTYSHSDPSHRIHPSVLNNSMNNIFPHTHQVNF